MDYVFLGSGLAFSAAVQPGPLQAFLLARVAQTGWRRTLPACLSPLLSDGPIALVSLLVLGHLPASAQQILRAAGGLLLIYFAWISFRQWRAPMPEPASVPAPRTLRDAVLVNLLNPNPYLGWTLVLGPSLLTAWEEDRSQALLLLVSFYGTMVVTLAGFVILFGTVRFLNPLVRRSLHALSIAFLAVLGILLFSGAFLHLTMARK
jgi:threonine/homoserine/homoserine lactone efflux protein